MLDEINNTCKYVTKNAKYIRIDNQRIEEYFNKDNKINTVYWLSSNPFGLLDLKIDDLINFLLIYDSMNFCFWGKPKWHVETSNGLIDGSFGLLSAFMKEIKQNKEFLNFNNLEKLSLNEFKEVLKGNIEIPLLEERYNNLIMISHIVNTKMQGNFYKYISSFVKDEDLFDVIIESFPCFADIREYNNKTIYFYKLAQLLTSDILNIRSIKEGIKVDLSHLVGCADYKIPQVLRNLGITIYNEELSNLIDNGCELEENSEYEIEIRATMITALDLIKKRVDDKISTIEINDYIWSLGQNKAIMTKPYHLTKTVSY